MLFCQATQNVNTLVVQHHLRQSHLSPLVAHLPCQPNRAPGVTSAHQAHPARLEKARGYTVRTIAFAHGFPGQGSQPPPRLRDHL